jgi:restriction endonuclease S subunit
MTTETTTVSVPRGWSHLILKDACELITDGSHFSPTTVDSGLPYITVRDLGETGIDFFNCKFISRESFVELAGNGCQPIKGDVLFSKDGTVGKVALVSDEREFVVLSSLAIVRPNKEVISSEFLKLTMQSPSFLETALGLKTGTALSRIVLRNLKTVSLAVPPPAEQEKIVAILEEQLTRLDAALASVRAVRVGAGRFRRSLLNAAFVGALTGHESTGGNLPEGWDSRQLRTCLEKLKSGKLVERGWSPQCLSHPAEGAWGVLKTTSVQMGEYLPEYNKELPTTLEPKVGLEVNDGDFLVTTTGPRNRCGVVCHVRTTPKKLIFSGKILRFRADENQILASYLMYLLMSPKYQKVLDQLKVGTSDSSVSIGNQQILELEIPVASIDEQLKIVEILEEQLSRLDASLAVADAIEKRASALRRSLLHAAFTGELTKEWREGVYV